MTAAEFKNWRARMGWSQKKAADELGVGLTALQSWERGRRGDGKPAPISKQTQLACEFLERRGIY